MKNTLINMILVLGGISTVAAAGVGYVYKITEAPIAAAVEADKKAALGEVLPAFDAIITSALPLVSLASINWSIRRSVASSS